jgi:serine phosphatase RsbU (regulator of sigma subunit)/tetratricopeptide (TPR) repeat protein
MKKILFLLTLFPTLLNAQVNIDSLLAIWNDHSQQDTNRLNAVQEISKDIYLNINPDSALYYAKLEYDFATIKGQRKHIANALNIQGSSLFILSEYNKALIYHKKSLLIRKKIGNQSDIASSYTDIGRVHNALGNYDKSIINYNKGLKIYENIKNNTGIAKVLSGIGKIHYTQGNNNKALEYQNKSLKIIEKIGDKKTIANSLSSIGSIYFSQGDTVKAIETMTKSLDIFEEINDKLGIAKLLNNLGYIYFLQGKYDKSTNYHKKSLLISKKFGDKRGISFSFNNLAHNYHKKKASKNAIFYCESSLDIAKEIGASFIIRDASELLWEINKDLGKSKESLEAYELYITTRDSMVSKENQKAIIQQEFKYAYEKQAAADSIKAVETSKVKDALLFLEKTENKQRKQQQYYLYAGLILALLFSSIIFNRFKLANKQKEIIKQQKEKVDQAFQGLEEAHKEITDSINYAERIQHSFLATKELLDENLNDHFVFFQPKNIVSGDFYWAKKLSNGSFAMINADSTGHGVPGAIMSILNISSIESAVKENLTQPAAIFNHTRKSIIEHLKKDGSTEGGKDGMDASLICFNSEKTKISYVAAQNPIWIIRDSILTEIKPEKMPIGKHENDNVPFYGGEVDIKKGDQIYTLTDGFQDQFGGPKDKKFMVKKMRKFVLSISHLPLVEQHEKIKDTFNNWKGDFEQTDDVCVIGIKI